MSPLGLKGLGKGLNSSLRGPKCSSPHPPSRGNFWVASKKHVPSERTLGGPPLWVIIHVTVKYIEGLYDLWRVRYTLAQMERHRTFTTEFPKAWADSGSSPAGWIPWCLAHSIFFFCGEVEKQFSIFLHPHRMPAWALQEKAHKLLQGSIVGDTKCVGGTYAPLHEYDGPSTRAFAT